MKKKLDEEIIIEWFVIPLVILFALAVWWLASQPLLPQEEEKTTIYYGDFIGDEIPTETVSVENSVESVENTEPQSVEMEMIITAYCPCEICCGEYALNRPKDENGNDIIYTASGNIAKSGVTIAVDPDVIPYGSKVIIDGKTYIAEDCGGAIKGNRIDVYFDTHQKALDFVYPHGRIKKVVKVML